MKNRIRLTESQLHRIIKSSVKKILRETKDRFDDEAFYEWEEKTVIPKAVLDIVKHVTEKVGCPIEDANETITLRNRDGYPYGWAKGFTISYCTSSMEDGTSTNYAPTLIKWLQGLGFVRDNSHGDNGMDSETNWHDTYWYDEFYYKPSFVPYEQFMIWGDDEY